jgi:hypothetical protein
MPKATSIAPCLAIVACALLAATGCKESAGASKPQKKPVDPAHQALEESLKIAQESLKKCESIKDYTCVMLKRERINGVLLEQETMFMKIRHEPFSVYTRFEAPESKKGQEAIYVEGKNDNKLIAHSPHLPGKLLGTLRLRPEGWVAMRDNLHPITDAGIKNLLLQTLELASEHRDFLQRCETRFIEGKTIDDRPCKTLEIRSPAPYLGIRMAIARIYLDVEWNLPVGYESYEFADDPKAEPLLLEQYFYTQLKFNQNLTDSDFDPDNPEYGYPD